MSTNTAVTSATRGPADLDNLLRRELKVGDPSDPTAIARALMERYRDDHRTRAIEGESRGLPFLHTPLVPDVGERAPAAIDIDLEQVHARIGADLQGLIADPLTATMRPELEGWQGAIRLALDEGVASARLGIDPARRDVAFAARRQLGEYSRIARLVGLFSPALRPMYRGLARSLDDAASVLLVLAGDAMANLGFSGGRFLLQTSYADLQGRRDAVLAALRRIDGVAALQGAADGGGTWPRGLRAHRQMQTLLEARGQGELRALASEAELARTLDELIQLASGGTPWGLRSLGSTAWSPLARLRRFVRTVSALVDPASHELAALVEAMRLFIEGFDPAGGHRLMRIARPSLLGQTAGGLADERLADRRLSALVTLRSTFAVRVEAFMGCRCEERVVQAQAALDRVLFGLDRAIDDYANGTLELGLCEVRASALHTLTLPLTRNDTEVAGQAYGFWGGAVPAWVGEIRADAPLVAQINDLTALLRPVDPATLWVAGDLGRYDAAFDDNQEIDTEGAPAPRFGQLLHDEIASAVEHDTQAEPVLRQMATRGDQIDAVLGAALRPWHELALGFIEQVSDVPANADLAAMLVPPHFEVSLQRIAE